MRVSITFRNYLEKYSERFLEGIKPVKILEQIREGPLVSICIPAFNYKFFEKCLRSALNQTYKNVEVVVCDDSPNGKIYEIIKANRDTRILYYKNERNLGAKQNIQRCIDKANGKYIKFLNDDDILAPECVSKMVTYFEVFGDSVSLVTSKRDRIDANDKKISDIDATAPLFYEDTLVGGRDIGNFMLARGLNIIGEPTTAMFRKSDVYKISQGIINLINRKSYCNVDQIMWLNLLTMGDCVYISQPLSYFREHDAQLSKGSIKVRCSVSYLLIILNSRLIGYVRDGFPFLLIFLRGFIGVLTAIITNNR
ncbi:MAG: glycosyltransferase family 2 protein [Candidatus Parvarchaeota archaeon]